MKRVRGLIAIVGMVSLITLGLACAGAAAPSTTDQQPLPGVQPVAPANAGSTPPGQSGSTFAASELPPLQIGMGQTGISVAGESVITLTPDLALVNLGVETVGETVAEARDQAATAMDAVKSTLHSRGIADSDIQTQHFNISSRYEWREEMTEFGPRGREVHVGYGVSNLAVVKVRDLASVGTLIDEVATAGGDAIRVNGISFTVDDQKPYMAQLQEAAISDAVAKATRFADLTNVQLGKLVFLSDSFSLVPMPVEYRGVGLYESAAAAQGPATSFSGGQLELRMVVQAVFDIQ